MIIDARKLDDFGNLTRARFAAIRGEAYPLPAASQLTLVCKALQEGFADARNAGAYANPWTIAGIGKRETRNCAVLARLWDPLVVGEVGRRFLIETLRIADPTAEREFPTEDLAYRPYSVICESCISGDAANRMDIVIQSLGGDPGWTIVIEAKVDANLGKNQLGRYSLDLADRNRLTGRKTYLILLSPRAPSAHDTSIPHINWGNVASAADIAVGFRTEPSSPPAKLIRQFAEHISSFHS